LTRIVQHPALFEDPAGLQALLRDWHAASAGDPRELEMPDEVVQAVNDQDDIVREHRGPPISRTL